MHTLHKYLLYIYLSTCILCTLRTAHAQSEVFFFFFAFCFTAIFPFPLPFQLYVKRRGKFDISTQLSSLAIVKYIMVSFLVTTFSYQIKFAAFRTHVSSNGCARTHLISFYNLIHYHGSYQLILLSSNLKYHLILN